MIVFPPENKATSKPYVQLQSLIAVGHRRSRVNADDGCRVSLAARDPNLVNILPCSIPVSLETWLSMHEDLRNHPRCKVTFDALAMGLQACITS